MIELRKYNKSFGDRILITETDLVLEDDKLYGLVGESGSGKTTLMRNLSLLDPTFNGDIVIDGVSSNQLNSRQKEKLRIENFSYIFSEAYLLDYLSVKENACLSSYLAKDLINEEEYNKQVFYLGLDTLVKSKVSDLSAGEKQRIAILRALMTNRKYLICDEPTAHVDPENALKILTLFQDIAHHLHKTVLVALHDYSNLKLFDQIYQIKERKVKPYDLP